MTISDPEPTTVERPWYRRSATALGRAALGVAARVRRGPRAAEHPLPVSRTGPCPYDFDVVDPTGVVYAPWTDGRNLAMRVTSPEGWTEFYALVPSASGGRPDVRIEHVGSDHCCPWTPVPMHEAASGPKDTPADGAAADGGPRAVALGAARPAGNGDAA